MTDEKDAAPNAARGTQFPTAESVTCSLSGWATLAGEAQYQATWDAPADSAVIGEEGSPANASAHVTPRPGPERLERLGIVGRGGFGSVHAAMDHFLRRTVAMKILDQATHRSYPVVLRFVEEAQITAQLEHPNIVPVHDLGLTDDGRHFFTMKMVQGQTLTQLLRAAGGSADQQQLQQHLQIFLKVCDAVSFAHSRGVVHRDLKPDNIMVGPFGQVYVMDWGIAQLLDGARPSDEGGVFDAQVRLGPASTPGSGDGGLIVGTFAYMAPEQARGQTTKIDQRTDVFALGAMLYQLLTAEPPYTHATAEEGIAAARKAAVRPPDEVAPTRPMPPGLVHIAMKALAADPDARYQTVQDMKADIETFLRGGSWFATRSYQAGDIIVREGEEAHEAFIIVAGHCEVYVVQAGTESVLRTLGPGEVFGETAIFTSQPRSASVRAVTPLTAMVVSRESLEEELGLDSWIGLFVKALAQRFRDVDALNRR